MKINRQLIQKYNTPVPRYTSYPPANFFAEMKGNTLLQHIEASNSRSPENISIYIHIPFCKRLCYYCGCNSCPMAKADEVKAYIEALKTEIALVIPKLDKSRKISQIHYGGGTPNAIQVEYLQEINQLFFDNFSFIDTAEIAIECHPAYLDETYIDGLKKAGFNRYSLGIQDFNLDVLKASNRTPSKLPIGELAKILRTDGKASVNFDFIYGLPLQTKETFLETINTAIELQPDRLVTFSYAHVPWVNSNMRKLEEIGLPGGEEKIDMTEAAYNLLEKSGYRSIGMDHYVREKDELFQSQLSGQLHRNFQGYCTRATTGQVYAFGVSGISQLNAVFAQNTKSIPGYIDTLNSGSLPVIKGYELSDNENIIGQFISHFMCNKNIQWAELESTLGYSAEQIKGLVIYNKEKLQQFKEDEVIDFNHESICMLEDGLPFIRNVVASFDPLLQNTNKTFSKSV